jgi:hypothetical protein
LLYFAGHGIQPTVNTAYWLLSRWENNSSEAINVNLSCYNAKRSGIGQIAIFADACRSTVPGAATVCGSSIFPIFPKHAAAAGRQPQWDHFLASRLEEVAQEVPGTKPAEAYGVFTRCLMAALSGEAREAIEERRGKDPLHAVTSQRLADYLEDVVPLESGKIRGAQVQFPEAVPGWRPERNWYLGLKQTPQPEDTRRRLTPASVRKARQQKRAAMRAQKAVAEATGRDEMNVRASTKAFAAVQGRESFETRQGLTIIGATPTAFVVRGREVSQGTTPNDDLFKERDAWHVRGKTRKSQSVLVKLEGGSWIATCLLPQFVGTVVVKEGLAASINYAPARGGQYRWESFEEIAPLLNRWTALMHQGRYADTDEIAHVASTLRKEKHSNPSLGIFAAYAYERAGVIDEIDDIAWWFALASQPIPFDIAMLSTVPLKRLHGEWTMAPRRPPGRFRRIAPVAGSFPLLTQGWSFLDPTDKFVHGALFDLRAGLLPALWTTLRADEGQKLAELVRNGKLT